MGKFSWGDEVAVQIVHQRDLLVACSLSQGQPNWLQLPLPMCVCVCVCVIIMSNVCTCMDNIMYVKCVCVHAKAKLKLFLLNTPDISAVSAVCGELMHSAQVCAGVCAVSSQFTL